MRIAFRSGMDHDSRRPWRRALRALGTAATLGWAGTPLAAQAPAGSLPVQATVLSPIVVTGQRDLDFGTVTPGVPVTVSTTDLVSGRFRVRGGNGLTVLATFTLPGSLTNGAATLPVGAWTARWSPNAGPGGTSFNPLSAGTPVTLSGGGQAFLFLGATLAPGVGQPAGAYAATITLSVAYQ